VFSKESLTFDLLSSPQRVTPKPMHSPHSPRRRSISRPGDSSPTSQSTLRSSSSTFFNETTTPSIIPPHEYSRTVFTATPRSFAEERFKHNQINGQYFINKLRKMSYSSIDTITSPAYAYAPSLIHDEYASGRQSRKWLKSSLLTILLIYLSALIVTRQFPTSSLATFVPHAFNHTNIIAPLSDQQRNPAESRNQFQPEGKANDDLTSQGQGSSQDEMAKFRRILQEDPDKAVDVRVVRETAKHTATIIFLHVSTMI
jgi:hypothetical protein